MEVMVAGEPRTWTEESYKRIECGFCGSRAFKRSKISNHWYCKGCNENYEDEKPWFALITCSKHGLQPKSEIEQGDFWCADCDMEAFADALDRGLPYYSYEPEHDGPTEQHQRLPDA